MMMIIIIATMASSNSVIVVLDIKGMDSCSAIGSSVGKGMDSFGIAGNSAACRVNDENAKIEKTKSNRIHNKM